MSRFEGLPLQAEERLCKAEAHFCATSRGSNSARVPSERRMKAQGLHRLSSLPVSAVCFIIPSAFPRVKTALSHCHTDTYFYKFLFLFSVFLTFISLVVCCVFHFCYYLPFSLPLSVPTSLQPSMPVPHFLSFALLLCMLCYSSVSDHWHKNGTRGSASPGWI